MVDAADHEKLDASKNELHSLSPNWLESQWVFACTHHSMHTAIDRQSIPASIQ